MSRAAPPSPEHGRLIAKLESIATLGDRDRQALAALPLRTRSLPPGQDVAPEGTTPTESCFVVDGLMCRYAVTGGGGRQIVSFHISGDLPDRDSLHIARLDHSIASVSSARVAFIPHTALFRLAESFPNLAVAFWRDAVVDAAIYRQWLTSLGRRTAKQRVAHLLCETFTRMEAVGLADTDHFQFPVTQTQLADALGLSSVHINRTIQELREERLITWKGPVVTIPDVAALYRAGDFDPSYLQLKSMPAG